MHLGRSGDMKPKMKAIFAWYKCNDPPNFAFSKSSTTCLAYRSAVVGLFLVTPNLISSKASFIPGTLESDVSGNPLVSSMLVLTMPVIKLMTLTLNGFISILKTEAYSSIVAFVAVYTHEKGNGLTPAIEPVNSITPLALIKRGVTLSPHVLLQKH